jgi:hypothetical protein
MRARHILSLTVPAFLAVACPVHATETTLPRQGEFGRFSVTIGAEYTSGEYGGSADTDVWYFPLTLRYAPERWVFRVTLPYLVVHGPGDVLIAGGSGMGTHMPGGMITAGPSRTDSGVGDIIGSMSHRLLRAADDGPSVDLTGKVYLGTADEDKGLGTGENDYAAQIDAAQRIGAANFFGTLGYQVTGDPPGIDYKDIVYGTFGMEHTFGHGVAGVVLDAQQASVPGNDRYVVLTAYLTTLPGRGAKPVVYLLHGLSDAAPDWGIGMTYSWRY